jgi:hypothetical protein
VQSLDSCTQYLSNQNYTTLSEFIYKNKAKDISEDIHKRRRMLRQEKARAAAAGRAARKRYEWRAFTLPRAIAGIRGFGGADKGSSEARTEVLKARADGGELAEAAGAAGRAPPSLVGM